MKLIYKLAIVAVGAAVIMVTGPAAHADSIGYIPGATAVQTWTAIPGQTSQWSDWLDWDSGNSIDASGNKVLGTPPDGDRGAMYINDTRLTLPILSYKNSGMAMSYTLGTGSAADAATYLEMFTFDGDIPGDDPDKQRMGFIIASEPDGTGARTIQQFHDGDYRIENWAGSIDLSGTHTMALALVDQGVAGKVDVISYLDGVEMNRFEAVDPLDSLTKLGVGYEYTGNQYAKRGTLVSEVTAFTIPEPDSLTLVGATLLGAFAWRKRKLLK